MTKLNSKVSLFLAFTLLFGTPVLAKEKEQKKIKNLILMIGDGMGVQHVGLLLLYAKFAPHSIYKNQMPNLEKIIHTGETGLVIQHPHDGLVIDSACSASQLASGVPSLSESIGLGINGKAVPTIAELAKQVGKSVGIISDTRLTHATPAGFLAHVSHRSKENEIAEQMLASGADVLLSGGLQYFLPKDVSNKKSAIYKKLRSEIPDHLTLKSKRHDSKNLLEEAKKQGYDLAFDVNRLNRSQSSKLLGLFTPSGMPDGIENTRTLHDPKRKVPTLSEMSKKGLEVLSKNEKGFFLMIEGGQIDWASHGNVTGTMLHEMLKFDQAIGEVLAWAKDRDDTLIVVTADHETGSFGLSYASSHLPKPKKIAGGLFAKEAYAPNYNFGSKEVLDKIYNQKKSYFEIFDEFESLPKSKQIPNTLRNLINKNLDFKVTFNDSMKILKNIKNPYFVKNHPTLGEKTVGDIGAFAAFYPYPENIRGSILSRIISKDQFAVWGTGTHSSSPVGVYVWGPEEVRHRYDGLHSGSEIGKLNIEILDLKK